MARLPIAAVRGCAQEDTLTHVPERITPAEARYAIIETRRGAVECAVYGEGPAVLLLHGAMGGYDQGLLLARTTVGCPDFRFIAVSRPGYLATPLSLGRTPEEQSDLCANLIDALGIPKVAVIAISGGGQCALQFALRHPGRCWGLIMISACTARLTADLPLRFHLMRVMAHFPALCSAMSRKAAKNPDRAFRRSIPDPALRARTLNDPEAGPLLRALQASTAERMAERLPGALNDITQSRLPFAYPMERISTPVLAVHGTADELVPFAHARSFVERIPGAELLAIDGGRHVSIFTHRAEVQTRITQFLSAHAPSASVSKETV